MLRITERDVRAALSWSVHSLESVATIRRLVAFYVDEHNRVLPFASVVEVPESAFPQALGPTLVLTAITSNPALRDRRKARHSAHGLVRRARPHAMQFRDVLRADAAAPADDVGAERAPLQGEAGIGRRRQVGADVG